MARFSLQDFNDNRDLLKTSIEHVERLTALRQKLVAIEYELSAMGYYETEFSCGENENSSYTAQEAIENLICCLENGIEDAKDTADFAAAELAMAIFNPKGDLDGFQPEESIFGAKQTCKPKCTNQSCDKE